MWNHQLNNHGQHHHCMFGGNSFVHLVVSPGRFPAKGASSVKDGSHSSRRHLGARRGGCKFISKTTWLDGFWLALFNHYSNMYDTKTDWLDGFWLAWLKKSLFLSTLVQHQQGWHTSLLFLRFFAWEVDYKMQLQDSHALAIHGVPFFDGSWKKTPVGSSW